MIKRSTSAILMIALSFSISPRVLSNGEEPIELEDRTNLRIVKAELVSAFNPLQ